MTSTWATLRAQLQCALTVTSEHGSGFVGTTDDGRQVIVDLRSGTDVEWVVLRTPICAQEDLDPVLVLERNSQMAFVAMVLMQGMYWLRHAVPFDSLDVRQPGALVALLVDAAHALGPHYTAATPDLINKLFSHYVS